MKFVTVDPHTFPWDYWLQLEEQPDTTYRPRATHTVERTYAVQYGRHQVVRTYRIITTHPRPTDSIITNTNTPEEATS